VNKDLQYSGVNGWRAYDDTDARKLMKFSAAMSRDLLPETGASAVAGQSARPMAVSLLPDPRPTTAPVSLGPRRSPAGVWDPDELPCSATVSDNAPLITPTRAGMPICWNRRRISLSCQLELEFDARRLGLGGRHISWVTPPPANRPSTVRRRC